MKILSIAADLGVMIGIRTIVTMTEITIVIAIIVVAAMSVAVGAVMNAAVDVATDAVNVVLDNVQKWAAALWLPSIFLEDASPPWRTGMVFQNFSI